MMDLSDFAQPKTVSGKLQIIVMRAACGGDLIGMHQTRLGECKTPFTQHNLSQVAYQLVSGLRRVEVSIEQVLIEIFGDSSLRCGHRPGCVVINLCESLEQLFQLSGREGITSFQREKESQMIFVPESGSPAG